MGEYEIESGVPVPKTRRTNTTKWPWPKMGDGDSIEVDSEDRKRGQSSASAWLKRHRPGWHAISRETGEGKARIWFEAGEPPEDESEGDNEHPETPDGVTTSGSIEDAVEGIEPPA